MEPEPFDVQVITVHTATWPRPISRLMQEQVVAGTVKTRFFANQAQFEFPKGWPVNANLVRLYFLLTIEQTPYTSQ